MLHFVFLRTSRNGDTDEDAVRGKAAFTTFARHLPQSPFTSVSLNHPYYPSPLDGSETDGSAGVAFDGPNGALTRSTFAIAAFALREAFCASFIHLTFSACLRL